MTHPDGRIQRMRQSVGHTGEVRPGWWVLDQLCALGGKGLDAITAPGVTSHLAAAVPFYAGIGLDEIGGRGVRWQDRDAASALPAGRALRGAAGRSAGPAAGPPGGGGAHSLVGRRGGALAGASASSPRRRTPRCRRTTPAPWASGTARRWSCAPEGLAVRARGVRSHRHAARRGVPHRRVASRTARWRSRPPRSASRPRCPRDRGHDRDDPEGDRDLRLRARDRAHHPVARAQAPGPLPVPHRAQPGGPARPAPADGRRAEAALQGAVHPGHRRAVDDGHRPGDLDRHRRGHAGRSSPSAPSTPGAATSGSTASTCRSRCSTSSPSGRSASTG